MTPKSGMDPPWRATNTAGFEAPAALGVDVVVLTVGRPGVSALAIRTTADLWALPGGLVGSDESPEQTAIRKLAEKTGVQRGHLEQLATFAEPGRDPRGWIPTIAYLALVPAQTVPSDPSADWISATHPPPLAYDHGQILTTAIDRVRGKLWWSNVAVGILPDRFTLAQAREVYEAIADVRYDPSTFARDLRATGLVTPVGDDRTTTGGRPAALYRFSSQGPSWGAGRRKRVTS
jgi:8-oxo-dGTP diphosphatase